MNSPLPPGSGAVTFDLAGLNDRFLRERLGQRIAGVAVFGGLGTILIGVLAYRWQAVVQSVPKLSLLGIVWLFEIAVCVGMMSLGVSLFIIASPNLTSIRMDSSTVILGLRHSGMKKLRWDDPRLHIEIESWEGRVPPDWSTPICTHFFRVSRGQYFLFSPTSALTVEAFDALLQMARSHALSVIQRLGMPGIGARPLVYDIRAASRA